MKLTPANYKTNMKSKGYYYIIIFDCYNYCCYYRLLYIITETSDDVATTNNVFQEDAFQFSSKRGYKKISDEFRLKVIKMDMTKTIKRATMDLNDLRYTSAAAKAVEAVNNMVNDVKSDVMETG